ncbi:MAG: ABC transporter ATP-binding protein [Cyclobacteriaceae bacterium]
MQEQQKGNKFDWKVLKRLLGFMKPYLGTAVLLLVLMLIASASAILKPVLIGKYAIDKYLTLGDYENFQFVILLAIGVLFLESILQYFIIYLSSWLGQNIVNNIRIRLYHHVIKLKTQFFDKTPIGQLVTRNVSDIETLSEVFSQGIAAMLADIFQLLFIITAMVLLNWRLALLSFATLPFMLFATYVFKEKIKVAFTDVRNAVSKLNTFVQERISGMMVVQIFNAEEREYKKFKAINEVHKEANVKTVNYYSIYFPVAEMISAIGVGLVVWRGSNGVLDGWVNGQGELIMFIMYLAMFFRPIRLIADRFNTLQMGIVSTARVIKLLDNNDFIDNEGSLSPDTIQGAISFDNVWFAYNEGEDILKGVSFNLKAGEKLAIVGSTGAGKSTIINLLNKFYSIHKGTIAIDGHSIDKYQLEHLRKSIGVVQQDVFLFSASIYDNITLRNRSISKERVIEAAKLIGADSFINNLPGGLDYVLQERGSNLSVGQRQLLAFIRVVVYDPKIIVLDEATSSIDSESEALIQQAIDKLMDNRTAIVIAHRLSTIQKADSILVMEKGTIIESGSHQDLLANNKHYKQLHDMQYKMVN